MLRLYVPNDYMLKIKGEIIFQVFLRKKNTMNDKTWFFPLWKNQVFFASNGSPNVHSDTLFFEKNNLLKLPHKKSMPKGRIITSHKIFIDFYQDRINKLNLSILANAKNKRSWLWKKSYLIIFKTAFWQYTILICIHFQVQEL